MDIVNFFEMIDIEHDKRMIETSIRDQPLNMLLTSTPP